jgi:hypothetical protein
MKPICKKCRREPNEISEYINMAEDNNCTPEEFVVMQEGTYNHSSKFFYCTDCYIKIGMPSGKA